MLAEQEASTFSTFLDDSVEHALFEEDGFTHVRGCTRERVLPGGVTQSIVPRLPRVAIGSTSKQK